MGVECMWTVDMDMDIGYALDFLLKYAFDGTCILLWIPYAAVGYGSFVEFFFFLIVIAFLSVPYRLPYRYFRNVTKKYRTVAGLSFSRTIVATVKTKCK